MSRVWIYVLTLSRRSLRIYVKKHEYIEKRFSSEKFGIFIYHPYLNEIPYLNITTIDEKGSNHLKRFSDKRLPFETREILDCNLFQDIIRNVTCEKLKEIKTLYFYENLINQDPKGNLFVYKLKKSLRSALEVAPNLKNIYFEFRLLERYNYSRLKDKNVFLR
jgi:hypothetical protein